MDSNKFGIKERCIPNSNETLKNDQHYFHQIDVPTRLASQIRNPDYNWKGLHSKVISEDDVWLGYRVIVKSGIKNL